MNIGSIGHFQHLLLLSILLINLLVPLMLVRGRPCTLAVATSHDTRNLGYGLGNGRAARLLVLASGNLTLLGVDYVVLCFLVNLILHATNIGALAIMMIKLGCVSLIIDNMVSSSSFWSVYSRPTIDVRPRWLGLASPMRWPPLLLRTCMSGISCSAWMLRHRTQLATVSLHQACDGLWVIYDKVIDVVVVYYVGDILALVWSW